MRILVIIVVLSILQTAVPAQGSRARRDRRRGVSYALTAGWPWAPAPANRIAVEHVSPEGGPALKARLEYEHGEFRQIRIAEIRESLRDSPGALKSFAIKQPARMRGYSKAIRVSYEIPRGEPAILWRVNHWLARRKGNLYEWIEEVPRSAGKTAKAITARGRNALHFGKVSRRFSRVGSRSFRAEMVAYGIPIDWDWASTTGSQEKRKGSLDQSTRIMALRTRVLVKGKLLDAYATLRSMPIPRGSLNKVADTKKALVSGAQRGYVIIRSYKPDKKRFAGRPASRFRFVGKLPPERSNKWPPELGQDEPVSQLVTRFVFKNGQRLVAWTEYIPTAAEKLLRPLIEKARGQLSVH